MDKTRKIISDETRFEHFKYYLEILDEIDENIHAMPDIAIESCKSLIEGISKTILDALGESYVEKGRSADGADNLVRKAIDKLSAYTPIDQVFAQSVCGFVKRTSEVRNERGDISHGKSVPKKLTSDSHLSEMVAHITDNIVFYILRIFFNTKLPDFEEVKYEKNIEFNQFLDSQNMLDGIVYSQALFDQDLISYKQQLVDFESQKETE